MKCPGCGTELTEGSNYCNHCGGRIEGSNVDYSQVKTQAADVYDDRSYEPPEAEPLSKADEYFISVGWMRFAMALVALPFLAFISIVAGLDQKRTEYLSFGILFLGLEVVAIITYLKYYRDEGGSEETEDERSMPKYLRRV